MDDKPLGLTSGELLNELREGRNLNWDIIVIGGGITGAGVLREAARRGYRSLLLEQSDFSWGTSSRSSKMVHGGLRYLVSGDINLTKHSLRERERLIKEASGLVERISFYFSLGKGLFPGRWAITVALAIYDLIAGVRSRGYCNNKDLIKKFQGLEISKLNGACFYTDAMVDDSRLVLRVLQEAIAEGATALNYIKVTDLILEQEQVRGLVVNDPDTGRQIQLRAPVIVNATGAWADKLRSHVNSEQRIRPLRGSHLIIPRALCPLDDVLAFLHPEDKRNLYIYPWEGTTVIGTTDLDHPQDLDIEASISESELDYLISGFSYLFPHIALQRRDIISTWAGVRPVIGSDQSKDPSKERRDHAVWSDQGLITVSGGKLTTFRLIALDVLKAAQPLLPEAQPFRDDRIFAHSELALKDLKLSDIQWAERLLGRYGNNTPILLSEARPEQCQPIAETLFCMAECQWALRYEAVVHLDDLLLRRTRLGMLLPDGGAQLFDQLKNLCRSELGWSEQQWQTELKRYNKIWQQHYSLPTDCQ
jgi:glycerol-3-phosphate dehydrogenase